MRRLLLILSPLCAIAGLSMTPRQDDGVVIERLKLIAPEFDDVCHLLGIRKITGDYELTGSFQKVSLVMEVHRKGEKLEKSLASSSLSGSKGDVRKGRFTIQVADLERLKLGDAKGQERVYFAIQEGVTETSVQADFDKSWFDLGEVRGSGTFRPRLQGTTRIPLFWRAAGEEKTIAFGETPDVVIKKNPKLDVLIAYLELN